MNNLNVHRVEKIEIRSSTLENCEVMHIDIINENGDTFEVAIFSDKPIEIVNKGAM